jgi:hypothetical protein
MTALSPVPGGRVDVLSAAGRAGLVGVAIALRATDIEPPDPPIFYPKQMAHNLIVQEIAV